MRRRERRKIIKLITKLDASGKFPVCFEYDNDAETYNRLLLASKDYGWINTTVDQRREGDKTHYTLRVSGITRLGRDLIAANAPTERILRLLKNAVFWTAIATLTGIAALIIHLAQEQPSQSRPGVSPVPKSSLLGSPTPLPERSMTPGEEQRPVLTPAPTISGESPARP